MSASEPAGTAAPNYAYDVFISYSHADGAWVRGELLPALEAAGLHVCIDFRDFARGAPGVEEMERAVQASRHTLLVLTPAYLASAWAAFEALMLQTLDPANHRRSLIPLLKERCELPPRISYLTYVDFVTPENQGFAWTQLLTALGAPPLLQAPVASTPPGWFLPHPYAMPPNFTGRDAERALLSDWLNASDECRLLALRALGGFGKSALCWHWLLHDIEAARWSRVVWWSFYESDAGFESFLRDALAYLGGEPQGLGPRQQADELLDHLRAPGTLLVLDGFERALRAFSGMGAAYQGDEETNDERRTTNDGPTTNDERRTTNDRLPTPDPRPLTPERQSQDADRDCVSPFTEQFLRGVSGLPGIRGKLLLTTRLRPRILEVHGGELLEGCREVELTQMQPADAVAFFRAQGVRGARAEIEAACERYGYHPLSLWLLAGLIATDLRQPGDIEAARCLDLSGDLVQRKHHVLEQAYASLAPARQQLLSRIACFRGPVSYETLVAVASAEPAPARNAEAQRRTEAGPLMERNAEAQRRKGQGLFSFLASLRLRVFALKEDIPETTPADLDAGLRDLIARGLLHHDRRERRYDLHPIVRRYAYDHLGAAARSATHRRLRDYFAAAETPEHVQRPDELLPLIELYHHTVRAGQHDEARSLFRDRIHTTLYYQLGAYQLQIELLRALFPDGEDQPPRLHDESAQAWTLHALANSYSLSGQPRRAMPLFEQHNTIQDKLGDKSNLAVGLGAVASVGYTPLGLFKVAEANLRRSIALGREIEDRLLEAAGHQELGRLLTYRGAWDEAEAELNRALALAKRIRHVQGQGIIWTNRALWTLLKLRVPSSPAPSPAAAGKGEARSDEGESQSMSIAALTAARRALELADGTALIHHPVERDYVCAYWLLGAAHLANGDLAAADQHLSEALARCRVINAVDAEADILLDLARLRAASGERAEALRLAAEALLIAERSGYVLQGADVHLFLARMALEAGDEPAARRHAGQARALARCDGPPDYTYKVVYDEAGALLGMASPE